MSDITSAGLKDWDNSSAGLVTCPVCLNEYETDEPCGKRAIEFRDKPEHHPLALYEDDIHELFERVADTMVGRRIVPSEAAQLLKRHMIEIMKENADPKDDK